MQQTCLWRPGTSREIQWSPPPEKIKSHVVGVS
jgi:hypothetical protein